MCIWKKLGDISVGSWKVSKKGTKHPAPKLKYAGAMKMHSYRICFCSVSKSLCDLGQVSYHLDFCFPEAWTGEGFLLAKDTVTLLALWRCEFIEESVGDCAEVLFILSFVGSWKRMLQKMEKSFFWLLIFEKTK